MQFAAAAMAAPMPNMRVSQPTAKVELSLSARNLKDRDVISKSDPFAVLYLESAGRWLSVGETETLKDNLEPRWAKLFLVDYYFEMQQRVRVEVYDRDASTSDLRAQDLIGSAEFSLGQLMGSPGLSATFLLTRGKHSGKHQGSLQVKAEEAQQSLESARFRLSGSGLLNMDGFFGKSDPFLVVSRQREDQTWITVHRTETIDNNLNPTWRTFELPVQKLCNGDYRRALLLQVMDEDSSGKAELMGQVTTCLEELVARRGTNLVLQNAEMQRKKGKKYTNAGLLQINELVIARQDTFVDFLRGGMEISLMLGIDYTASNGPPTDQRSLHFINPSGWNQYQQAIYSTGSILESYDSDKKIAVYGFGGIPPNAHAVDHCFALNMNPSNPEVAGVQGVLQLYSSSLYQIRLHGPTFFAPLIQQTMAIVASSQDGYRQKYFVLLIITDGEIMDMPATIDAIVQASHTTPLSIVIIGVGSADFSSMNALDADKGFLRSSRGQTAARDIVQFVPYSRFAADPNALTRETLAEIPSQVCQYMKARGIRPNAPVAAAFQTFAETTSSGPAIPGVPAPASPAAPIPTPQQGYPPQQSQPGVAAQPQGYPPQQQQGYPPQQPQPGVAAQPQGYPPQQQQGLPPQQQGYPPQQPQPGVSTQQQGYPPQQQGYPPQQQGYPPQQQGYPPQQQGYPPQQQGYPPQQQGYPPQQAGYPPQQQGSPPQQQGYPPQQQGYPPQQQGYPPQQAGYPPQQQGYPPQQQGYGQPGIPPQGYPPQGTAQAQPPAQGYAPQPGFAPAPGQQPPARGYY